MQKEKSQKKNFYIGKKTAKRSLVILFALVIYTAPTVHPDLGQPSPISDYGKNVKVSINSLIYRREQHSQSTMGMEIRGTDLHEHQQHTSCSSMSTFSNMTAGNHHRNV
jgi:hypothetical protein